MGIAPGSSTSTSLSDLPELTSSEDEHMNARKTLFGFSLLDDQVLQTLSHLRASKDRISRTRTVFGFPVEQRGSIGRMTESKLEKRNTVFGYLFRGACWSADEKCLKRNAKI